MDKGATGNDVRNLQKLLNEKGFTVATEGPGSKGNETNLFGFATKEALIKFQEAHAEEILVPAGLTKGTGFFGEYTRKYVNSIIAEQGVSN